MKKIEIFTTVLVDGKEFVRSESYDVSTCSNDGIEGSALSAIADLLDDIHEINDPIPCYDWKLTKEGC